MIKVEEKLIKKAARKEDAGITEIKKGVCAGHIVIPKNKKRKLENPCAIGKGMTTKVNANIGLSPGISQMGPGNMTLAV